MMSSLVFLLHEFEFAIWCSGWGFRAQTELYRIIDMYTFTKFSGRSFLMQRFGMYFIDAKLSRTNLVFDSVLCFCNSLVIVDCSCTRFVG